MSTLVDGNQHEFAHPQLDDGAQSRHGSANTNADLRRLGNRREADALFAEFLEHGIAIGHGHILAVEDNIGIALHLFNNGCGDCIAVHHFSRHVLLLRVNVLQSLFGRGQRACQGELHGVLHLGPGGGSQCASLRLR